MNFKPTNKKPLGNSSKKMERNFNAQIRKSGVDLSETNDDDVKIHNNSLAGVIEEDLMDNNLNVDGSGDFDDREYLNYRINKIYDTMNESNRNSKINHILTKTYDDASDSAKYNKSDLENMSDDELNALFDSLDETTSSASSGSFAPALNAKNNVYENKNDDPCWDGYTQYGMKEKNGKEVPNCVKEEENIDETTTSASSGQYSTPHAWAKDGKKRHTKPAYPDGEIVSENYLVDASFFKELYNQLNEGMTSPNDDSRVPMAEDLSGIDLSGVDTNMLKRVMSDLMNNISNPNQDSSATAVHQELVKRGELKEDLSGIDLSNVDTNMLKKVMSDLMNNISNPNQNRDSEAVHQELVKRGELKATEPKEKNFLNKIGSWLKNEEYNMNEHHMSTRNDKIDFILNFGQDKFGDESMLNDLDNQSVDRIYKKLEDSLKAMNPNANKFMQVESEMDEASKSQAQQRFMGQVYAAKKGELDNPSEKVKDVADSMSMKDAKDFASTKHDGLPEKVDEDNYQRKFVTYNDALGLANQLDNAPVEDEENIVKKFASDRDMSVGQLKSYVQSHIQSKLSGSESPEYFKMENVVTIINDMLDQVSDAKRKKDKDQAMRDYLRTPQGKEETQNNNDGEVNENPLVGMAARGAGMAVANKVMGENVSEKTVNDISALLKQITPDYAPSIEGFKKLAHLTVSTFFGGDYNKAYNAIKSKMGDLITNEGILSDNGDTMAIDSNNPTSMASTMKDGSFDFGGIGESDNINLDSKEKVISPTEKNELRDFGTSEEGHGGKYVEERGGKVKYNPIPRHNEPNHFGAPRMEESNDPVNEDGHCRRDEVPVAGKVAGEKGSCKKKKTQDEKSDDNKFNVKFRKKKEKERIDRIEKKSDDYQKELDKNRKQMNKIKEMVESSVNEDKRPSALVQMDRLHKDNQKNFNSDFNDSNTSDVKIQQDELTAQDQIQEVGDNPYELAEKIEKDKMKQHKFNSFENNGNSTNDNNKEIPKRNTTESESEDIMKNRGLGMQDIVYDNIPDERFEKRMKKDMGENIYDQRQEKMKYRSEAPMYNKDSQPIDDGVEKDQFEKNISKYNSRNGVNENRILSAKYRDELNKLKLINFNLNEAIVKDSIEISECFKLDLNGMGNIYNQTITESTDIKNLLSENNFYLSKNNEIIIVNKGKVNLNESTNKTNKSINESVEKMKKLVSYNPSTYVNTNNIKKNRGF